MFALKAGDAQPAAVSAVAAPTQPAPEPAPPMPASTEPAAVPTPPAPPPPAPEPAKPATIAIAINIDKAEVTVNGKHVDVTGKSARVRSRKPARTSSPSRRTAASRSSKPRDETGRGRAGGRQARARHGEAGRYSREGYEKDAATGRCRLGLGNEAEADVRRQERNHQSVLIWSRDDEEPRVRSATRRLGNRRRATGSAPVTDADADCQSGSNGGPEARRGQDAVRAGVEPLQPRRVRSGDHRVPQVVCADAGARPAVQHRAGVPTEERLRAGDLLLHDVPAAPARWRIAPT